MTKTHKAELRMVKQGFALLWPRFLHEDPDRRVRGTAGYVLDINEPRESAWIKGQEHKLCTVAFARSCGLWPKDAGDPVPDPVIDPSALRDLENHGLDAKRAERTLEAQRRKNAARATSQGEAPDIDYDELLSREQLERRRDPNARRSTDRATARPIPGGGIALKPQRKSAPKVEKPEEIIDDGPSVEEVRKHTAKE